MKALPTAVLAVAFCWVARAAEDVPMAIYFANESSMRSFNPIHETPVVLILDTPFRAELLARWRKLSPQTDAGLRLKGLLLEDAGNPQCRELLQKYPGDRIRLLWRAGKMDEARLAWQRTDGDRVHQAAAAMLPVVARGDADEIARFRDFLLDPLSAEEVVSLCLDGGLPETMWENTEVKKEWLIRFPHLAVEEARKLPDAPRLALLLQSKELTREEFEEIRQLLKSPDRGRGERVCVLEALASERGGRHLPDEASRILLGTWMESHPEEVAEIFSDFAKRGIHGLAWESGLPGIVCLRRELEQRPDNRAAALSLAVALHGWEDMPDEIARVWRLAANPAVNAPGGAPSREHSRRDMQGLTLEESILEFAEGNLPERYRVKWMEEWMATRARTAAEAARMAAWLGLSEHFWRAWPDAIKDSGDRRILLECIAYSRIGSARYEQRKAIDTVFAEFADEPWAEGLRDALGAGTVIPIPNSRGISIPSNVEGIPHRDFENLHLFRYLLANALAVENPLRRLHPIGANELERNGGIALHGYFASSPDNQGNGYFTPIIGQASMARFAVNPDVAAINAWLGRVDGGRLSRRSARSLEVAKVAFCSPLDQQATDTLREKLKEWWDKDRDPDAGKMLLSYRRTRDRSPWPDWEDLWKEVAATLPPDERAKYAGHLEEVTRRKALHAATKQNPEVLSISQWMRPSSVREPGDKVFPYRDMGRSEGFMGFRYPWTEQDDEESLRVIAQARKEGLDAIRKMGASDLEMALARARLSSVRGNHGLMQTLFDHGRITRGLAVAAYPDLRELEDQKAMKLCLDLLCDRSPDKALSLLDDPWLIEIFGPEDLETWTQRALAVFWFDRRKAIPQLNAIVKRLAGAGKLDAAMKVAAAASLFNAEVLPVFPAGEKRREYLAAWLTSKPEELRMTLRRSNGSRTDWKNLPELQPEEWRELATLLATEERRETRKPDTNNDFVLLYALLSAGVDDVKECLELGRIDADTLAKLLGRAASVTLGRDDFPAKIRALALSLARFVEAGERSEAVLQMLAKYPVEDADITPLFVSHARAYRGSPTDDVLQRTLAYGEVGIAFEMAKRLSGKQDTVNVILPRVRFFTKLGHHKEAWMLAESQWPSIKERITKQSWPIRTLLPLARQVENIEAVRYLVDASPDPKAVEVEESVKWLENRKDK